MNKIWILDLLINIAPNIFELIFNKTRPNSEAPPEVFYKERCS